MSKQHKGFKKGRRSDSDEIQGHVRPIETDRSIQAPADTFVDIPQGMVPVLGVEVDHVGLLRKEETGELAIWHHRCKPGNHGPCERYTDPTRFVTESEVVFIAGAPWCPDCVVKMQEDAKRKELHDIFGGEGN